MNKISIKFLGSRCSRRAKGNPKVYSNLGSDFPGLTRVDREDWFAMDARVDIKGRPPGRHPTEEPARAPRRSTRAAAHLPAIAEIFKKSPCVPDLKPHGRDVAKDMHEVIGIPLLMKTLLDNGHLHGDGLTVTGRTISENLKSVKGNLAPEGAIVKVAGIPDLKLTGPARRSDAFGPPNVKLSEEPARRKTKWRARATKYRSGALSNFARQVGPAVGGTATGPGGAHEKQCYADI